MNTDNHTKIDINKVKSGKNNNTVSINNNSVSVLNRNFSISKYVFIFVVSLLFFLSGFGFWIYVNYYMP